MSMLVERETSAGSEGARRATGDPAGRDAAGVPDPEVSEQAKRRRFTAEYKLRIVREADACKGDGDVAALLRREGLYSSQLSSWRRQRDEIATISRSRRFRVDSGGSPAVRSFFFGSPTSSRPEPGDVGAGRSRARSLTRGSSAFAFRPRFLDVIPTLGLSVISPTLNGGSTRKRAKSTCEIIVSVRSDHVAESRKAREPWCIPPEERSTKEARDGDRQKRGDIEIIGKAALVGVGCAGGGVGMAT